MDLIRTIGGLNAQSFLFLANVSYRIQFLSDQIQPEIGEFRYSNRNSFSHGELEFNHLHAVNFSSLSGEELRQGVVKVDHCEHLKVRPQVSVVR